MVFARIFRRLFNRPNSIGKTPVSTSRIFCKCRPRGFVIEWVEPDQRKYLSAHLISADQHKSAQLAEELRKCLLLYPKLQAECKLVWLVMEFRYFARVGLIALL